MTLEYSWTIYKKVVTKEGATTQDANNKGAARPARAHRPGRGTRALHSLRLGGGFSRSSKLKVRAARGGPAPARAPAAGPVSDGLRIPSRVSSVRCAGAGVSARSSGAVEKGSVTLAARAGRARHSRCGHAAYRAPPAARVRLATPAAPADHTHAHAHVTEHSLPMRTRRPRNVQVQAEWTIVDDGLNLCYKNISCRIRGCTWNQNLSDGSVCDRQQMLRQQEEPWQIKSFKSSNKKNGGRPPGGAGSSPFLTSRVENICFCFMQVAKQGNCNPNRLAARGPGAVTALARAARAAKTVSECFVFNCVSVSQAVAEGVGADERRLRRRTSLGRSPTALATPSW
ncbi:hypothetical protein EVAR_102027_1 [Eumeta japonica]|uniref:Uncharacterized protein n=1 Tax=Eumeta variegata TaxID=151549 RepID=A0A4C1TZG8_EUMVA|nr:hypothetical protein EVAR_102027_1 [Eumeta japonica]